MENLINQIYFERQDGALCAQHALNNLLRASQLTQSLLLQFTAPDLASLARDLDDVEMSYRSDETAPRAGTSHNMDDSGFFSIQVLDDALKVFGLKLVRWRGEEMRPFQSQPELQPAFVLNLEAHWFTLRRFGPVALDFHWFNLNSLLKRPEYVSNTFLGMTLQQAETEGYSVFVVRALDDIRPTSSSPLPETNLDIVAATIPRLTSYKSPSGSSPIPGGASSQAALKGHSLLNDNFGFEDEDLELQRALQASLAEGGVVDPGPVVAKEPVQDAAAVDLPDQAFSAFQASMARQRETLALARREQEEALRESVQNEVASGSARRRQTAGEEEEEEMMRRALEESMATVKGSAVAEEGGEYDPSLDMDASPPVTPLHSALRNLPPPEHFGGPRMLDDEDAELQAALRASLEDVPEGFSVPEVHPPVRIGSRMQPVADTLAAAASPPPVQEESALSAPSSPVASVDVDEMRRRRLERFNNK